MEPEETDESPVEIVTSPVAEAESADAIVVSELEMKS
jgi:hypothetical protein